MKKILIGAAIAVFVIIEVVIFNASRNDDTQAPVITVDETKVEYKVGCSNETILKGVKAKDSKDGDVSYLTEIVSRSDLVEDEVEVVEIAACDKEGNLATKKVVFLTGSEEQFEVVDYDDYEMSKKSKDYSMVKNDANKFNKLKKNNNEDKDNDKDNEVTSKIASVSKEPVDVDKDEDKGDANVKPTKEITKEPTKNPTKEPTSKPTKNPTLKPTIKPTIKPTQKVGSAKPVIKLKYNSVTVRAGSSTAIYLNSIASVSDDKDSAATLYKKIGMTRSINLSVRGVYTQGLYCIDSDGNHSNVEYLKVIVQ